MAELVVTGCLFGVCGMCVLLFEEAFTALLAFFFDSILFIGDRGLRSILRFIDGLLCLSRSLMLEIFIVDLVYDCLLGSFVSCCRLLLSLYLLLYD